MEPEWSLCHFRQASPTFSAMADLRIEQPITVRCSSRRHQVKLDPRRFWRRAACPICRAEVDRWRMQRMWGLLRADASAGRRSPVVVISWAALLGALLVASGLHLLGDRHWIGTAVLFAGRWPWIVPALIWLAIVLLLRPRPIRRAVIPATAAALIILFWVMDFRTGWRALIPAGESPRIRVMTFNTNGDGLVANRLDLILQEWSPDVLALQECGLAMREALKALDGWFVDVEIGCLASRFPVDSIAKMPRDHFQPVEGAAIVTRYHLQAPHGPLVVTNIHLETARHGLERLLTRERGATGAVSDNTTLRDLESEQARRWVTAGGGPAVVLGDFNMPIESAIYRKHWGDFTNAWNRAGRGLGHTKDTGWILLRIDHVLSDNTWRPVAARTGPSYGSDHWPVIVDLIKR